MKSALASAVVTLALLLSFLLWVLQAQSNTDRASCANVNELKAVLVRLVDRGDANLRKYKDEGLINTQQLRRSLKQSVQAREDLASDACD